MMSRALATIVSTRVSGEERDALRCLRIEYQAEQHIFTAQELARLRFLRWLVQCPHWNYEIDRLDSVDEEPRSEQMRLTWTPGISA